MSDLLPWQPEESVGRLWHRAVSGIDAPPVHEDARVALDDIVLRLAVFHRGLGGAHATEIKAAADEESRHRLSLRRRVGNVSERLPRASFDGAALRLPHSLAVLPLREANATLYLWLAAMAAHAAPVPDESDPFRADVAALRATLAMTRSTLDDAPGLVSLHAELARACLAQRRRGSLPRIELALERVVRRLLGDPAPLCVDGEHIRAVIDNGEFSALPAAPADYRPFLPVPLWLELRRGTPSAPHGVETREASGTPEEEGKGAPKRARRQRADQAERKDSLILHRFEAILGWAEFLNLNRRIEDDDEDDARKAADDQDEMALGQVAKSPATRLKIHLDLAPEDVDREALSGVFTYPEWDCRSNAYLPAHTRVLASAQQPGTDAAPAIGAAAARRIRSVRRQFEALRPVHLWTSGNLDGEELDMDAAIRAVADLRATGEANDRVWRQLRPQGRDLAVSILLDTSRSTESAVTGRPVIDIEREALTALAWGIDACGDDCAIHAFSSLKRERVFVRECKGFGEPMSQTVEARIAALRPGFYTRLGAAVRHCSAQLTRQSRKRRLLLVITDGKPNDLDHYEGRHGIEDSAMAVREARRAGHAVFGITVDRDAKGWFPRIFGRGGHALVPHPDRLTVVLPAVYRHLVQR